MAASGMGRLRRFWEFLLTAGEYPGETRAQRGRRRIMVGLYSVSVPATSLALVDSVGPWIMVLDGLKALNHLAALLLLWVIPRQIVAVFFASAVIDLLFDTTTTILLGGLYEAGLAVTWSLLGVLTLLIISTVRVAALYLVLYLAALVSTASFARADDPLYVKPSPEADAAFALVAVALFMFVGLFYFVRQRDRLQRESDDLLHNILPDEIASRLKTGNEKLIADHFDDVSVLFLDVVDFTPMSADMTPTELVGLLDDIFSDIDGFVDDLGLEKIKTVGDEYMVAAGIPVPRPDHASVMAELALRIRERFAAHNYGGNRIVARIGINSGPVVAGIIGTRKFSYDLWGDVVNTASRMESHGVPGRIQISAATYGHVEDEFECEQRGTVTVKGKGDLETWFLIGRRDGSGRLAATDDRTTSG